MKKASIFLILIALIAISIFYFTQKRQPLHINSSNIPSRIEDGYPTGRGENHQLLKNTGFHLQYNEETEQADWTIYILTGEMVKNGKAKRKDHFIEDNNIKTGSAIPDDYKNSGFDRGHLVPAADMKWSESAMEETFKMSNISPQKHNFNAGLWKILEEKVRDWAVKFDSLLIVTGPVFTNSNQFIGENNVRVPDAFFKVIFDIKSPDYKCIGFLMKNESKGKNIEPFALSVDSLEKITGYDFFSKLPDDIESELECCPDYNVWMQ